MCWLRIGGDMTRNISNLQMATAPFNRVTRLANSMVGYRKKSDDYQEDDHVIVLVTNEDGSAAIGVNGKTYETITEVIDDMLMHLNALIMQCHAEGRPIRIEVDHGA